MALQSVALLAATVALLQLDSGAQADVLFVVGGEEANITDYPWQVFLRVKGFNQCGGTIVSDLWVLTAAHCLFVDYISAGSELIDSGDRYEVAFQQKHPQFDSVTKDYDIAVVKVANPFKFSEKIQPVKSLASEEPAEGTSVKVTGWGDSAEDADRLRIQYRLRVVTVKVASRTACETAFNKINSPITSRMFCAASPGKDACQGDSGGPVVKANSSELVGIVSWGEGCARLEYPGVYTSVAVVREWIKETTGV